MLDIRRVLQIFLQMVSCLQSAVSESGGLSELEEEVASVTRTAAHRLLEHALEAKDKQLADERNKAQWELVSRKTQRIGDRIVRMSKPKAGAAGWGQLSRNGLA